MTGNISKSKGFKGERGPAGPRGDIGPQGEKGDATSVVLRYDQATGDLYYSSDGIMVDKEYIASQNIATTFYVDEKAAIVQSDVDSLRNHINAEAHFRGYLSTNDKIKALQATPNDFAYSAESETKWVYDATSGWQDTGVPVPDQAVPMSDATPLMNGEASAGTSTEAARGDHRHPTDNTRASVSDLQAVQKSVGDIETALLELESIADALIAGANGGDA